jgi:hypothetical protein
MFCVDEAEATLIREAWHRSGELGAAVEVRRLFPGITDNENARRCARAIASWSPRPAEAPAPPADATREPVRKRRPR